MSEGVLQDRKSTRLNSSHVKISYAVCCLKKKKVDQLRHDHCVSEVARKRPAVRGELSELQLHVVRDESALRFENLLFFFFNDTAATEIYTLSLHDALPI